MRGEVQRIELAITSIPPFSLSFLWPL